MPSCLKSLGERVGGHLLHCTSVGRVGQSSDPNIGVAYTRRRQIPSYGGTSAQVDNPPIPSNAFLPRKRSSRPGHSVLVSIIRDTVQIGALDRPRDKGRLKEVEG